MSLVFCHHGSYDLQFARFGGPFLRARLSRSRNTSCPSIKQVRHKSFAAEQRSASPAESRCCCRLSLKTLRISFGGRIHFAVLDFSTISKRRCAPSVSRSSVHLGWQMKAAISLTTETSILHETNRTFPSANPSSSNYPFLSLRWPFRSFSTLKMSTPLFTARHVALCRASLSGTDCALPIVFPQLAFLQHHSCNGSWAHTQLFGTRDAQS